MILGVRRENPTGVLSEEVKLLPIKRFGEEAEEETMVRFSMFIVCFAILVEKTKDMMMMMRKGRRR